MPLPQGGDRHQFSVRSNANEGQRARKRNPAFNIQSRAIDAQLISDVDEDAVSVKLPKILARIDHLPINSAHDVSAVCVEHDRTYHSDFRAVMGRSRTVNQGMWIERKEQLLRAEPGQRFLIVKVV